MKTKTNFEKDLRESCALAAEFLRKKDKRYNKLNKREGKERLYSSEAPSYRDKQSKEGTILFLLLQRKQRKYRRKSEAIYRIW
jgi:hypothetical protein